MEGPRIWKGISNPKETWVIRNSELILECVRVKREWNTMEKSEVNSLGNEGEVRLQAEQTRLQMTLEERSRFRVPGGEQVTKRQ